MPTHLEPLPALLQPDDGDVRESAKEERSEPGYVEGHQRGVSHFIWFDGCWIGIVLRGTRRKR